MKEGLDIKLLVLDPHSIYPKIKNTKTDYIKNLTYTSDFHHGTTLLESKSFHFFLYVVDQNKPSSEIMFQIRQLVHKTDQTKMIIASGWAHTHFLITCIRLGIYGFYNFKVPLEEAILHFMKYHHFFGTDYQSTFLRIYRKQLHRKHEIAINFKTATQYLSNRELEVLQDIIFNGGTQDESANRLFISIHTLKNHIKNIRLKLGASNCTQIISNAMKKGILYKSNM
ncbi:response regulator transcription factor [Alkalihalobacillus sp. TS-13]|uniref:response regulator transcription factor n=1 Tax=Alkalihalobacillus sp. TS-13 TaxID=2842455 RepID=UPI001C883FB4|nr:LuxR C-terminal-related transcriptional regulator [Alkalihalobacillus sp. TS-13]